MAYGSRTRDEVLTELAAIDSQLTSALVPDGSTAKTALRFGGLRRELRARRAELIEQLRVIDAGGVAPCQIREY